MMLSRAARISRAESAAIAPAIRAIRRRASSVGRVMATCRSLPSASLTRSAADTARRQEDLGVPACLLVPDALRAPLARLLKRAAPRLKVLAHSEIPETHSIRIGSIIGSTA